MTIVTQGYGNSGAIVTHGFGDPLEEGPAPPPPPPAPIQIPGAATGGGSVYEYVKSDIPMVEVVDLEPFAPERVPEFRLREPDIEVIDLTPLMLQDLLRRGKRLKTDLRQALNQMHRERSELELLRAQMKHERKLIAKERKSLIDARTGIIDRTEIPKTKIVFVPVKSAQEEVTPIIKDVLVPFGIGMAVGATIMAVVLSAYKEMGAGGPSKKSSMMSSYDDPWKDW